MEALFSSIAGRTFFCISTKYIKKYICFKVFIDEFENLSAGQQSFINGLCKHSHDLLSWNVAYKAHAQVSNEVSEPGEELFDGSQGEQLQKNHDYEEINLDKIINNLARSEKRLFLLKYCLQPWIQTTIKKLLMNAV
ncbi:ORC-CDC6 family AAA ATPase [Moraxella ovis]|uniref:ORC-CDC6 family AAA ATPase n=1 Tax=Moraxella ovis TaxID=29433 RepID=UPI003F80E31F